MNHPADKPEQIGAAGVLNYMQLLNQHPSSPFTVIGMCGECRGPVLQQFPLRGKCGKCGRLADAGNEYGRALAMIDP